MTCSSASQWFSQGISISSTNKTDYHDITEILLKVVLNTITLKLTPLTRFWFQRIYFYFQVLHIIQRLTDLPISVDVLQVQIYHVSNCIGGVIVRVLALSAVNRGFELWSDQTKNYKIGICCFSARHIVLRRKCKEWWARNQDNVSELGDMSIRILLF
jgi:hypothetical protein